MSVAVLFGGPSPEHDVSILTGLQAARAISAANPNRVAIYWSKTGEFFLVDPDLEAQNFADGAPKKSSQLSLRIEPGGGFLARKRLEIDVVLNCCHGGPGEDGTIQGAFDLIGIKYTGPSFIGAFLSMDKLAFAAMMKLAGLPSLPRALVYPTMDAPEFAAPYMIKPRFGGSSIGVKVIDSVDTAVALLNADRHYRQGGVIEPYRPDSRDLNIGIRTFPELALSAIESPIRQTETNEILTYADKYIGGEGMTSAPRELPAKIGPELESNIRKWATAVAQVCSIRGVARLDFLLDGDDLFVNEINPIPGSMSQYLWINPRVEFSQLLSDMIEEAAKAPSRTFGSAGADGALLKNAGSIASKLDF